MLFWLIGCEFFLVFGLGSLFPIECDLEAKGLVGFEIVYPVLRGLDCSAPMIFFGLTLLPTFGYR